jgi:hypothetical protein
MTEHSNLLWNLPPHLYWFDTEGVKKTKMREARGVGSQGPGAGEKDRRSRDFSEQPPASLRSPPSLPKEGSFRALRGAGRRLDREGGCRTNLQAQSSKLRILPLIPPSEWLLLISARF